MGNHSGQALGGMVGGPWPRGKGVFLPSNSNTTSPSSPATSSSWSGSQHWAIAMATWPSGRPAVTWEDTELAAVQSWSNVSPLKETS